MRKLAIFSAAFAAACGVYVWLWQDSRALWLAGACLLPAAVWLLQGRLWLRRAAVALFGIAVGIVWCFFYQHTVLGPANRSAGTEQTVTVQVLEAPQKNDFGYQTEVSVRLENRSFRASFHCGADAPQFEIGDRITCTAQLTRRSGNSRFELSRGLFLRLKAVSELQVEKGTPSLPVRVRLWMQQRIRTLYQGQRAGLLLALLTGDQQELSYAARTDMARVGLSHAVAVSGMHVSMLLAILCALCRHQPRLSALLGIPVVVFFTMMTGASPSACRAAVMQTLLLCAPLTGRQRDPLTSVGAAAVLLLLENPWVITNVSFQMSFLSVCGILLLSGPLEARLLSCFSKPGKVLQTVIKAVAPTLGATVATLPVTVRVFGVLSLIAPVANLLGLWAVTAMFTLGLFSCVLGPLGALLAVPVGLLADYFSALCRWLARYPFAAANTRSVPLLVWGIAAYLTAAVWLLLPKKRSILKPACVLMTLLILCVGTVRWQFVKGDGSFTALDMGQGQCLLLETQGFTAMVDCGSNYAEAAGEQAACYLNRVGMTSVDALIITHYDYDHVGGVPQLLHRIKVGTIFLPDVQPENPYRLQVEEAAKAAGTDIVYVSNTVDVSFSNGQIRLFSGEKGTVSNENGVCVLATASEYDILITGDHGLAGEVSLVRKLNGKTVDLLVAGHHGAGDSTSETLLRHTMPKTVVISVGENRYGHPAQEVLDRIEAIGAQVLRTDEDGTVFLRIS